MLFMKDKGVSFGKMFQLSLHTMTPIVVIAFVLDYARYTFFNGWVYLLAFVVWTLVFVSQLKPSGVNAAPVVTTPTPKVATKKSATTRKRKAASKR